MKCVQPVRGRYLTVSERNERDLGCLAICDINIYIYGKSIGQKYVGLPVGNSGLKTLVSGYGCKMQQGDGVSNSVFGNLLNL